MMCIVYPCQDTNQIKFDYRWLRFAIQFGIYRVQFEWIVCHMVGEKKRIVFGCNVSIFNKQMAR